jgi:hypothetical protein
VPYVAQYDGYAADAVNGCQKYWPTTPSVSYHTYGTGTSFAAPVVSAGASVVRESFGDRGVASPPPSLLKAALIATADTLGGLGIAGQDHRPSPLYGWGRINLDRVTDAANRRYVLASPTAAVATGQWKTYNWTIGDPSKPVYVVMVWDDPPSDVVTHSQAPLKNDLALLVGGGLWRGNGFNENLAGNDNGYSYTFNAGASFNDTINNVEAVFIPAGTFVANQAVGVNVVGINVPQGLSNGAQTFSLYGYNVR